MDHTAVDIYGLLLFYITSLYTFYGMYDEIIVTGVIGMRIIYDRNKSSRKR